MTRREAIARTAVLLGGAVSAPVAIAVLGGCHSDKKHVPISHFLTAEQEQVVALMAELILPETDTPGAVAAGVPAFVYEVVQDCFRKEEKEAFIAGLDRLNEVCKKDTGRRLLRLRTEKLVVFLKKIDSDTREAIQEGNKQASHLATWRKLKELTLIGYFNSEAGATQALDYVPIPGRLDTCTDLLPGQKAWAI